MNTFPIYFLEENIQKISINLICSKLRIIFIVIVLPSATSSITEGQWFSLGTLISSTNKADCYDIAEILLKVVLSTITLTRQSQEILNRPVFVLDILNSQHYWTLLKILNINENSEQILNIAENSEQILNITENSEQILNIIFLLKSMYFTSFSLDFN